MAEAIYLLCAFTSAAVAALLLRGYRASGQRLLLWSGLCFAAFFLNNGVLVLDKLVFPGADLSLPRALLALAGVTTLVYGLVTESA